MNNDKTLFTNNLITHPASSRIKPLLITALIVILFASAGCSGPYSAKRVSGVKLFKKRNETALNSDKPSWFSQQYLRLKFLDEEYKKNPQSVASDLLKIARQTRDSDAMIVTAELSLLNARKAYRKDSGFARH